VSRLLAIDVGITSGWAIFEQKNTVLGQEWRLLRTESRKEPQIYLDLPMQQKFVILEMTAAHGGMGKLGRELLAIEAALRGVFPAATMIKPADWKPYFQTRWLRGLFPQHHFKSSHERDAACIGLYFIVKKLKDEFPGLEDAKVS
jgi:hypothetical protein